MDTAIVNGTVVFEGHVAKCDIGVNDGKIAQLSDPGSLSGSAKREVEASEMLVIPGGVDPHVHCGVPLYNPKLGQGFAGDPRAVSRGAVHGGTTTVIDFAYCPEGGDVAATLKKKVETWNEAWCDFNLHLVVQGLIDESLLRQLPTAASDGVGSIKVFLSNVTPSRAGRMVDVGGVEAILRRIQMLGMVLAVHAEDDDLVMAKYRELERLDRTSYSHMPEVHSTMSEEAAIARLLAVARTVAGSRTYVMHVSAQRAVDVIRRARYDGVGIWAETLPQYLLATADDYESELGVLMHTYPSLKSRDDQYSLWSALDDGTIQTVATDAVCTDRETKTAGEGIFDATGGSVGAETRLSLMYTEGVRRRNWNLTEWVARTSTNAAKIFGLYPTKGLISVGSEADLVIFDPTRAVTLGPEMLHESSDYTAWDGRQLEGWPRTVFLRGEPVVESEVATQRHGRGRRVRANCDAERRQQ